MMPGVPELFSDLLRQLRGSGAATEYATDSGLLALKARPVDLPDGYAEKRRLSTLHDFKFV
jgi:hypothetical protein